MNIFDATPHSFKVGNRCRLKELPASHETQGTILKLFPGKAPAAEVQFDDGQHAEIWNTITLEPIWFRPVVLPKPTWLQIPKSYRDSFTFDREACTYGYLNTLLLLRGGITLVPVVTVDKQRMFHLGCNAFLGLDCYPIASNKYLLLNNQENITVDFNQNNCSWQVTTIQVLSNAEIVDSSKRETFRTWKNAYSYYELNSKSVAS